MAASAFRAALRADIPVVEDDGARLKFNPFANVSREEIEAIYKLAKSAAASAGGVGFPVGRVYALHQPDAPRTKMRAPAAGAAGPRQNAASTR